MARKYRKKPIEIEAVQWTGLNWLEVAAFCPVAELHADLVIPTFKGNHRAMHGDWIIRGVKGEFYPCKPDIFEALYDPVEP